LSRLFRYSCRQTLPRLGIVRGTSSDLRTCRRPYPGDPP
jgi:hypothetical protein